MKNSLFRSCFEYIFNDTDRGISGSRLSVAPGSYRNTSLAFLVVTFLSAAVRWTRLKRSCVMLCSAILLLTSCQKKLSEINRNPNAPEVADPQFLLSNVLYQAAKNNAEEAWKNGNLLAQHTSNIEFFPVDRYDLGTNTELWNATYRLLNDVHSIETSPAANQAYKGVALILRSHLAALLTDLWGDVPYSQAIKGASDQVFSPVYDKQQDIYMAPGGILDNLDKATALLSSTKDVMSGDILYKGDLNKWVRFANALKARYLVRISKKVNVSAVLQALVSQDNLLRSNNDNAVIPFLTSAPNQWFLINERDGRYADVRMSKTSENILSGLNDARISVFFKPGAASVASGNPAFKGLPNGLSRESQNAFNLNDISLIGKLFRDEPQGVNAPLMTFAEQQFILAEAALKGLIQGSANNYYQSAIQASHDYYKTTLPSNYLTRTEVALNGTDDLRKILTQKWISNFLNGYEAWLDVRRTGFPVLPLPKDNLNADRFPSRFRYPDIEQAGNKKNYTQASATIGGDTYNSKGWWEN